MLGAAEGSHNATNTNPLAAMDLWEKVFFLGSGNILGANGIGDIVATDTRGYGKRSAHAMQTLVYLTDHELWSWS